MTDTKPILIPDAIYQMAKQADSYDAIKQYAGLIGRGDEAGKFIDKFNEMEEEEFRQEKLAKLDKKLTSYTVPMGVKNLVLDALDLGVTLKFVTAKDGTVSLTRTGGGTRGDYEYLFDGELITGTVVGYIRKRFGDLHPAIVKVDEYAQKRKAGKSKSNISIMDAIKGTDLESRLESRRKS